MQRLFLTFPPSGLATGGWVALRNLRGRDEEAVGGTDTAAAIGLLDRLSIEIPGNVVCLRSNSSTLDPSEDRPRSVTVPWSVRGTMLGVAKRPQKALVKEFATIRL